MAHKKIAILGGSFNPVHYGHIAVARHVLEQGLADEVWLSLSPQNPFKNPTDLMRADRRMELLQQALAHEENIHHTDVELTLPQPSYTIDALDLQSRLHPDCRFTLIIGADNLQNFTRWKRWRDILLNYGLIVYPRNNPHTKLPDELRELAQYITVLEGSPLHNISSTEIRAGIRPGENKTTK